MKQQTQSWIHTLSPNDFRIWVATILSLLQLWCHPPAKWLPRNFDLVVNNIEDVLFEFKSFVFIALNPKFPPKQADFQLLRAPGMLKASF